MHVIALLFCGRALRVTALLLCGRALRVTALLLCGRALHVIALLLWGRILRVAALLLRGSMLSVTALCKAVLFALPRVFCGAAFRKNRIAFPFRLPSVRGRFRRFLGIAFVNGFCFQLRGSFGLSRRGRRIRTVFRFAGQQLSGIHSYTGRGRGENVPV